VSESLKLVGVPGSPYSRKMRAALRYRRIPFQWVGAGSATHQKLPKSPLPLMPILYYPTRDGFEATSDSTFMLKRLEREHKERSLVPGDPVVAFLDHLVEDYADEWVTKIMFHYRWAIAENVDNANRMLPRWTPVVPEEFANAFGDNFGKRQVDRLYVVGSNPTTAPIIEASYGRLLDILEQHLRVHPHVMGQRPGTSDFGLYGQLTQLVQVEPSSLRIARERAPRVPPWCDNVEDLSGLEISDDGWFGRDALPATFQQLLAEIGRTYAPFLLGNAAALASGAESVDCQVDGTHWTQVPFKYQGKCLEWLREAHAQLASPDRKAVDEILAGTGCETLLA